MTVVDLRKARHDDAAAIARLHVDTWRTTYAGMLPDGLLLKMSLERQTRMWERMLQEGETVIVADDRRVGPIGFGSYGPNRSGRDEFSGEVYTLYVAPDHQSCGVGRGLLQSLFGALAREGHETALIWVLAENPSRFFYEAMGGHRIAERDTMMWGATVRELAYGWADIRAVIGARA